jgi:hypothetical protein
MLQDERRLQILTAMKAARQNKVAFEYSARALELLNYVIASQLVLSSNPFSTAVGW